MSSYCSDVKNATSAFSNLFDKPLPPRKTLVSRSGLQPAVDAALASELFVGIMLLRGNHLVA
jgi:hypothetical protein